jgi:hypothetical protein
LVNRALRALVLACLGCGPSPRWPSPPEHPGLVATVASIDGLVARRPEAAWLLAPRFSLGASLAPLPARETTTTAQIRAFYTGPLLGLVSCEGACVAELRRALENAALRAHVEQRLLRDTEADRADGIAVDLSFLDEIDQHATAFVLELAAGLHAGGRKLGVIVRMTCRDETCGGLQGLALAVRAVDLVILEELDQDVAPQKSTRRARAVREALTDCPTARVYLSVTRTSDILARISDASTLRLGGVYAGRLGEDDACVFETLRALRAGVPPPACASP